MIPLLHRLLGRSEKDELVVAQKSQEAHQIKNDIQSGVADIMADVNTFKKENMRQLTILNRKLGIVSQKIAIATGGERRGL